MSHLLSNHAPAFTRRASGYAVVPVPAPVFSQELVAKYDLAGPRYTSYPTALQFSPVVTGAVYRQLIGGSNEDLIPRNLSLYLHIPFCRSPCFYCGCARTITRQAEPVTQFLDTLHREIALTGPLFDRDRRVRQLHLGGGTPNTLSLAQLDELLTRMHQAFSIDDRPCREFAMEMDPRLADAAYIHGLAGLGFNRLSLGIQDFSPDVQRAINRVQSADHVAGLMVAARSAGIRSVNFDLIYGLPHQTPEEWSHTLDDVIALDPDRIAVYGYAHMPRLFKAQARIQSETLPGSSTRLALFGLALERLTQAGYVYIGMDHFAREGDELVLAQRNGTLQRNFQGYSTMDECDLIGLGPTAIGQIGDAYVQNIRDLPTYASAVERQQLPVARGVLLTDDDIIRRDVIHTLMCYGMVRKGVINHRYGIDFDHYFADARTELNALADDGLLTQDPWLIQATARGRILIRVLAMCFDAYRPVGTAQGSKVL